jgi:uncharacterized membrane protein
MNLVHIHLLLNHFPTIGTIIGLGLYLVALIGKSDDLKRASLVVFVGIALITIPTYITGNASQEAICLAPADKPCPDTTMTATMQSGGANYSSPPAVKFSGGECTELPTAVVDNRHLSAGSVTGVQITYMGFGCTSLPQISFAGGGGSGAAGTIKLGSERVLVSKAAIETHESAALIAFVLMQITGALAWLGLWQFRRLARVPAWNLIAVLLLSCVTLGYVADAANIGGNIRHPEIVTVQTQPPPNTGQPLAREIGAFVSGGARWMWPTCETLHFIGLSLLIGVVLLIDLRMMGIMKNVPFTALHRLLPWGILGFGINVLTGMAFFVGAPGQYTNNPAFHWKIIFVLIAGLNMLYFTVLDEAWILKPGDDAPFTAKFAAGTAIFLWVGVMYCGSMLPFLGNAF